MEFVLSALTLQERRVAWLMTSVQFVSVLSFMVIMPLGPDYAPALGIDTARVGWVMAAYTLSSALVGLFAAMVLDRFDRRPALGICMIGLVLCNVAAAFAFDLWSLLLARAVAGLFGGPAGALSVAIVADNVPPERRGKAMGMVMGSLSISAVLGVPLALELSHLFGWRVPFLTVAGMGLIIIIVALRLLGPQRSHMGGTPVPLSQAPRHLMRIAYGMLPALAFALSFIAIVPSFMLISNMAVFVQFNLAFPREQLGMLYMIGGALSFFGMRVTGALVDRYGSTPVTTGAALGLAILIWLLYYDWHWAALPIVTLVPGFMVFNSARMVAQSAAVSKVPAAEDRAGFMALVQSVTQVAGGLASLIAAAMLSTGPAGELLHMEDVALVALVITLMAPPLIWALERRVPRDAGISHRVRAVMKGTSGG
ncbi:MFS transporter [Niveispirillum lacus]|uniref:MFS transporter n=1 Tax=Niveispirillum lacus TaxID=1981099 RepID=UPI001FEB11A3|nr:MFS transporter [Niveispirillum lacus]